MRILENRSVPGVISDAIGWLRPCRRGRVGYESVPVILKSFDGP